MIPGWILSSPLIIVILYVLFLEMEMVLLTNTLTSCKQDLGQDVLTDLGNLGQDNLLSCANQIQM